MNKVILIGRIAKEPDLSFAPGTGTAVTTIILAVNKYNSKTGQNEADFIPVVIWGKQAENLVNFLNKGSQVAISGRLQTRNYEGKDGQRKYVMEVVADINQGVKYLDNKRNSFNQDNTGSNDFGNMNQDCFR